MTTRTWQLEELFKKWIHSYHKRGLKTFMKDGILDEYRWQNVNPRVCFLLKDTNNFFSFGHWREQRSVRVGDMRCQLRQESYEGLPEMHTRNWSYLAGSVAYGLSQWNGDTFPDFKDAQKHASEGCLGMALVNVKKLDGTSTISLEELSNFALGEGAGWGESQRILKELTIIAPQVVVCGGKTQHGAIFDVLQRILQQAGCPGDDGQIGQAQINQRHYRYQHRLINNQHICVVDFPHPLFVLPGRRGALTKQGYYNDLIRLIIYAQANGR